MIQGLSQEIAISKYVGLNAYGERLYSIPAKIKVRLSSEKVRISDSAGETRASYQQVIYSTEEISTGDRVWLKVDHVDFDDPDDIDAKLFENNSRLIRDAGYHIAPSGGVYFWRGAL